MKIFQDEKFSLKRFDAQTQPDMQMIFLLQLIITMIQTQETIPYYSRGSHFVILFFFSFFALFAAVSRLLHQNFTDILRWWVGDKLPTVTLLNACNIIYKTIKESKKKKLKKTRTEYESQFFSPPLLLTTCPTLDKLEAHKWCFLVFLVSFAS